MYMYMYKMYIYIHVYTVHVHVYMYVGSCADIMHSAQPFRNGFKETVIALVLKDVINGLDYLHSLGFVHRYCTSIYMYMYTYRVDSKPVHQAYYGM